MEIQSAPMEDRNVMADQIKDLMISSLFLHHVNKADISDDTLFFEPGLGLDSVDVLEMVVAIEKKWGVKIDDSQGKVIFDKFGSLVDHIHTAKA